MIKSLSDGLWTCSLESPWGLSLWLWLLWVMLGFHIKIKFDKEGAEGGGEGVHLLLAWSLVNEPQPQHSCMLIIAEKRNIHKCLQTLGLHVYVHVKNCRPICTHIGVQWHPSLGQHRVGLFFCTCTLNGQWQP